MKKETQGHLGQAPAYSDVSRDKKIPLQKSSWPLAQDLPNPLLSYGLAS